MNRAIDLTGQRFGRLKAIERAENTKDNKAQWICECECGSTVVVSASNLRRKSTKSCGCLRSEMATQHLTIGNHNRKHGLTGTKLYVLWQCMKQRCTNPLSKDYKDYGGRGVAVCDEWLNDFQAFYNWSYANGFKEGLSIDRINVNGNYEPNNCRWVDTKEQANNKRNNHILTYNEETHTVAEWSKITGIKYNTLLNRINKYNWSIEKALTTP